MPLRIIKLLFFSMLLFISPISGKKLIHAAAAEEKAGEQGEPEKKKKVRLSQRRFYSLQPFTVPLLQDGEISEQFTIVISLELADENDRVDITYILPRIRNEVYNELLHLVTFRRRGASIPQIAIFKSQLLRITQRVTGEKVTSLVVQQAFRGKTR